MHLVRLVRLLELLCPVWQRCLLPVLLRLRRQGWLLQRRRRRRLWSCWLPLGGLGLHGWATGSAICRISVGILVE